MKELYLFVGLGSSMHPAIESGENIIVEKTSPENINFLDILVYIKQGRFFAHRILWRAKNFFIVKGDTYFKLEKVRYEDIFGRVTATVRENKWHNLNVIGSLYSILYGMLATCKWKIKKKLLLI